MYGIDCNTCKLDAILDGIDCKRCHDRFHFYCVKIPPINHPNLLFFCNNCTRIVSILLSSETKNMENKVSPIILPPVEPVLLMTSSTTNIPPGFSVNDRVSRNAEQHNMISFRIIYSFLK